ncbi:MAG: saccharopine dehydrogenase NADP-binding domain-containing protein [Alphaproteobacteria bacterium]
MAGRRALVLGGAGVFGRTIAERLAREPGVEVVLAGRTVSSLDAAASAIRAARPAARVAVAVLDIHDAGLGDRLRALAPTVVVDATGPFQGRDYRIPEAAIAAGASHVDIADGRDFVAGIGTLDAAARAAGVAVVSGASSVPGLTSAVADELATGLAVEAVRTAILPGHRQERGPAVMRAVLGMAGQPILVWEDGA